MQKRVDFGRFHMKWLGTQNIAWINTISNLMTKRSTKTLANSYILIHPFGLGSPLFHALFQTFSILFRRYETTNGIKVRQTSYMVGNNRVVSGYYSYIGPDGKVYTTHYTSDQNGYRATGSHLPVQDENAQPGPVIYGEPVSNQFVSSTPAPFVTSTPFGRNPDYLAYSPTTVSPIVSSSTPFQSYAPPPPPAKRLPFPVYRQPPQSGGYVYNNPRINSPYASVSQQTPGPISFQTSTYAPAPSNTNSRITTLAPPIRYNDFNSGPSSTVTPYENDITVQFKQYIPPSPIVTSTPRPFNNFSPNQPDTILITPKPIYQQQQLPNSVTISQHLVPPHLSVGPLNSPPPGSQNFYTTAYSDTLQPSPQTVSPLTVTNLNFRKKRDDEK